MTDIIANAQKLLDGAMAGPWIVSGRSFGVIDAIGPIERDLTEGLDVDSDSAELAAAAPELAQALAEETWEYAVQVKLGAKWLFLGRGVGAHNFARNAFWFVKKENAQDYMSIRKDMSAPTRIVRQRRSPVEVINE